MSKHIETEIEAKFLQVPSDIRNRLAKMGAVCKAPERLMRRKAWDTPDRKLNALGGWIRVRDEAGVVTMSYKQVQDRSVTGTKEVSLIINDFDTACVFLESVGFEAKSFQETKRESWTLGDIQIEIDTWPWIPSFIEIEAPSAEKLWEVAELLGLKKEDALHGSVEIVYVKYYDVTENEVCEWKAITFGEVPSWLEQKRRK